MKRTAELWRLEIKSFSMRFEPFRPANRPYRAARAPFLCGHLSKSLRAGPSVASKRRPTSLAGVRVGAALGPRLHHAHEAPVVHEALLGAPRQLLRPSLLAIRKGKGPFPLLKRPSKGPKRAVPSCFQARFEPRLLLLRLGHLGRLVLHLAGAR